MTGAVSGRVANGDPPRVCGAEDTCMGTLNQLQPGRHTTEDPT